MDCSSAPACTLVAGLLRRIGETPALCMVAGFAVFFLAADLFLAAVGQSAGQPITGVTDLVFVQAQVVSPAALGQRFPEGSRLVRYTPGGRPEDVTNLAPEFFAVADPQVSFDGAEVLFASKTKSDSYWQIWEMDANGSRKRQITHCEADCLRPAYLPRGEIVYTALNSDGRTARSQLWVSKSDGSDAHPITFGPGNFQVETVLQDGRILASASAPLQPATGAGETRELYTLRSDGTALGAFRDDRRQGVSRREATELDDGTVVFVKTRGAAETGGELAAFRRGLAHNSPLGPASGLFYSPRRAKDGGLIVSRKLPSPQGGRFDLYAFDTAQGRLGELLFADPHVSSLDAVPLANRTPPRWYWSTLNPQLKVGYFVCLNSRLSMDAPGGSFSSNITELRVLSLDASSGSVRTLGKAHVERDGSFYIAVPPDQPVRFELLDARGKAVQSQQSWVWARSGEEHGCVGCHEDKAVAPENNWPLALKRFDTPTRLGLEGGASPH